MKLDVFRKKYVWATKSVVKLTLSCDLELLTCRVESCVTAGFHLKDAVEENDDSLLVIYAHIMLAYKRVILRTALR